MRIRVQGSLDYETTVAIYGQLAPEGRFLSRRRLWDLRGCSMALTPDELKEFARMAVAYDSEPARAVVLVDSDLEFGLIRIHGVYRESKFVEHLVTRDDAEAVAWVLGDFDADAS